MDLRVFKVCFWSNFQNSWLSLVLFAPSIGLRIASLFACSAKSRIAVLPVLSFIDIGLLLGLIPKGFICQCTLLKQGRFFSDIYYFKKLVLEKNGRLAYELWSLQLYLKWLLIVGNGSDGNNSTLLLFYFPVCFLVAFFKQKPLYYQ